MWRRFFGDDGAVVHAPPLEDPKDAPRAEEEDPLGNLDPLFLAALGEMEEAPPTPAVSKKVESKSCRRLNLGPEARAVRAAALLAEGNADGATIVAALLADIVVASSSSPAAAGARGPKGGAETGVVGAFKGASDDLAFLTANFGQVP